MPTVQLTIETDDALPTALAELLTRVDEDDVDLTRRTLIRLLLLIPDDAVNVDTPLVQPDWERGDPCPECGETTLSVMAGDEDLYRSEDGEFDYLQNETAIGVQTSVFCPTCETYLRDIPNAGF